MSLLKPQSSEKPDYSSLVPAVDQASRILLFIAQERGGKMSLTEICRAVGIHKSKGYSILNTLQNFAFVQRCADTKTYSLGPGLLFLSGKVLNQLDIREIVAPVLHYLSIEASSTALLGLISYDHVFVVAKDEGVQDIGVTIKLGHRFPLAWGAHGKAIAAFLTEAEREKLFSQSKLYFHGSPSNLSPDRLNQEIADCQLTGFARDLGEMKNGVNAVASPVFGSTQKLIGALMVLGTFSVDIADKYGADVAVAAKKFSELLGGVWPINQRSMALKNVSF